MFGLKPELNKIKGYETVFFANDMDSEELMTYRELKQIHCAASALEGVESKMKGNMIIIDQKVYKKHDLPNLPHGLTLENVSTVTTPDGVAFSEHNNLYLYKLCLERRQREVGL